jgi:aryl sulfotransferase
MVAGMAILQAGFMKSGNFWLWNVIENALKQAGLPRKSFIKTQPIYKLAKNWKLAFNGQAGIDFISITPERLQYQIVPVFYWPIDDAKKYIKKTTHVWSHSPMRTGCLAKFQMFEKIVYIIRDPRDVAVSYHRFAHNDFHKRFFGTLDKRTAQQDWGVHVLGFLTSQKELGAHIVFYERLLQDWEHEFDRLLQYLEIDLNAKQKRAVRTATEFPAMKKKSALHLAKGQAYGWTRDLTPKEQKDFTFIHDRFIELLQYPMTVAEAEAGKLPQLPTETEVAAAIPNLWALDGLAATI